MNLHIQKSGNNNSKGFYIALGVCLIAVGVAAWTTYDSVVNYAKPESTPQSSTAPANNTVSGIYVSEPESSSSEVASSKVASAPEVSSSRAPVVSKPAPKAPSKQTSAKVLTFSYPIGKSVLLKFSEDPVFCKTTQDWRAHTGTDFTAATGDPVKAVADGNVEKTYTDDRYGKTVIMKHGAMEAWYCGLDQIGVKAGDSLKGGDKLGTVGTVPLEQQEAPHLHFILKKDGKFINPLTVLH